MKNTEKAIAHTKNFMHEILWNENYLHKYFIFMHENENFLWVKTPCKKLCTAQLPHEHFWAKKLCHGRNFHFPAWNYHYHA